MKYKNSILISFLFFVGSVFFSKGLAQEQSFTKQDTLRGSITPEREWWDLTYYHLDIKVNIAEKMISGSNTIKYKVLQEGTNNLQLDLQAPMKLTKAIQNGEQLVIRKDGNAHFIVLKSPQKIGTTQELKVFYEGTPKEAVRPPWDGGITWSSDSKGLPFVASSCQGLGASVWWPCKDHMYDEVEGMKISVNVPKHLMNVSNGRLIGVDELDDNTKTYHWEVKNPINNYGVNINIGDYVHFGEQYEGEKGTLDMDYYVLRENLARAKTQFKDAKRTIEAFEHWFGPYPFYEDSFKLVEAPYLGMEHQSSVTYGNGYQNGYRGTDLSQTGWGMKFDFIIVHESGHEWFANNITNKDIADMWIHESFTAYSENLFLDYFYGKEASADYVIGTRKKIQNDSPIIGQYGVNQEGSSDMYYKGANLLHTIRQLVDDDALWRKTLRGLNTEFYHKTVDTQEIEEYMCRTLGMDLTTVFDQYLRTTQIPKLEYTLRDNEFDYRWTNCAIDFDMKMKVNINGKEIWLAPRTTWKTHRASGNIEEVVLDRNFYIEE